MATTSLMLFGGRARWGRAFSGLGDVAPLLATAIPLGVYDFTEA